MSTSVEVVRAARRVVPAPAPVAATASPAAAAPATFTANAAPTAASPAAAPAAATPAAGTYDASLVGRLLDTQWALWGPAGEEQWYHATIVAFMPRAHDHVMHFDDGHVERISLPADLSSIRMLDEMVECCCCERCCCDGGAGQPLPLRMRSACDRRNTVGGVASGA